MTNRYRVRIYASADQDDLVSPGTIMAMIDRSFTLYGYSAEEAEHALRKNVLAKKLERGRVYQICPAVGNPEVTRTVAVDTQGTFQRVFLDPACGLYSEFRRVRLAEINIVPEFVLSEEPVPLR